MSHPHVLAALARERQNMLLAEAEAARLANRARVHRRRSTPVARSSPSLRPQRWLSPAWRRLFRRPALG